MRALKDLIRNAQALAILFLSVLAYAVTGKTPANGLQAMIRVHALTNGWLTNALTALFRLARPSRAPDDFRDERDLFATLGPAATRDVVRGLHEEGYAVSPLRVPSEIVQRLCAYADATPGFPTDASGKTGDKRRYDRADRSIAKFHFAPDDLANQVDIQNLAADSGLLDIAQRFLGCLPVLDSIAMWWSTAHLEKAADEIAQTFHIDYDRVRWLKVFIYLTDVTPASGAHVFVRHSHLREARRAELIGRGYVRLPDADIQRVYRPDEIVDICGPAGTVLFEDTSGFHKGKMPESKERLMLEFQFSCNLFGANYRPMHLSQPVGARLAAARRLVPAAYPMFT